MRMLAILLAASMAAQAESRDVAAVRRALRAESWKKAAELLTRSVRRDLAEHAKTARSLCRYATDRAYLIAFEGDKGERLVAAFEGLDHAIEKEGGNDAAATAARAEIRLLRARALRSALDKEARIGPRDRESPAVFREAAALFAKAYALDRKDPDPLARAVLSRIEEAWADPEARAEALARAEKHAKELEGRHGASAAAALARAALLFEAAQSGMRVSRTSAQLAVVRSRIQTALARLAPLASRRRTDLEIPTLYNELVAFAAAHKKELRIDAEFVADEWRGGGFAIRLPRSRLVIAKSANESQICARVRQFCADGRGVRRFVVFRYRWSVEYTTGPRGVGGDNPKGLLQGDFDDDAAALVRKRRCRRVTKGRLNRSVRRGYRYEILGLDAHDQSVAYRGYCFKCERHKVTLKVWIEELGLDAKLDPVGKFVIDSMRESR